jgi:hypothetical protein
MWDGSVVIGSIFLQADVGRQAGAWAEQLSERMTDSRYGDPADMGSGMDATRSGGPPRKAAATKSKADDAAP